jgi:hypothetical protein
VVSAESFEPLIDTLKRGAAALRDAQIPFFLAGGLASWARGGPPREHDVDFMVMEADIDRAADALAAAGFRIERPPEGWLIKAWDGDVLVDVIHRPTGFPVDEEMLDRADEMEVNAVRMKVMSADDILATKRCCRSVGRCASRSTGTSCGSARPTIRSPAPTSRSPRVWGSRRERLRGRPRAGGARPCRRD